MALKRSRTSLNVNLLGKVALIITGIFTYCEFLHYYVVISQCHWPLLNPDAADKNVEDKGKHLHAMVLADTHLLGRRNGHWFDKLRREWQMHQAFQTSITIHRPNIVMFLGDLFDEGKWCMPDEFTEYVSRFHSLFRAPEDTHFLVAAGNHDMGFHYSLNPYLVNRFQKAFDTEAVKLLQIEGVTFVIINSMAMEGDDCFLCRPALTKLRIVGRQLNCAKGDSEACVYWKNSSLKQYSRPVLLQHYPMFRESDAICNEPDEAPEELKFARFRERWECISKDSTDLLVDELSPRLVLSGHTHHGCHVQHNISDGRTVHEYTVSSFSWRNKRSPTFLMITLSSNNYSIYKCHMPSEQTVLGIYALSSVVLILWLISKKFRSQGEVGGARGVSGGTRNTAAREVGWYRP